MTDQYLEGENLNEAQLQAVLHVEGPLLVLSGAGTGKTKVLTTRIVNLINQGYAMPDQILAVTFTNKAAKEMIHRVSQQVDNHGLWLGTFHAIATKILRRHSDYFNLSSNFTVLGADDQLRIIKKISDEIHIDIKEYPPLVILNQIQRWKDLVLHYSNLGKDDLKTSMHLVASKIYPIYQKHLRLNDAVDFGDLLVMNIELLSKNTDIQELYSNQFKFILVDEYQDTNVAQYMWLRLLASKNRNLCCVGDEDQSIYGWRGAEIDNILRFEKDFKNAKIIRLEQNYRSTNNILSVASCLIANNTERLGKNLWSSSENGEKVKLVSLYDDLQEAKYIAELIHKAKNYSYSNIAILVRATFQTRLFEETFVASRIPYKIIGGLRFYDRQEIKDAISYLRVVANYSDNIAFERIVNVPKRGIGPSTMNLIGEYAFENEISLFAATKILIDNGVLKGKVRETLLQFVFLIEQWRQSINHYPLSECLEKILDQAGYIKMWENDKTKEAEAKLENIRELMSVIKAFTNVSELLEYISLVNDTENNATEEKVSIMTIHAAKGLEFELVILPGWEEGVFPHQRVIKEYNNKSLEEERRLAYVAITRAKKELFITKASRRNIFGSWQNTVGSRFISELPAANIASLNIYTNNYVSYGMNQQEKSNLQYRNNKSKFSIDEKIHHRKFGPGKIIEIEGNQLKIYFDFYGYKILLDSFVNKIEENQDF